MQTRQKLALLTTSILFMISAPYNSFAAEEIKNPYKDYLLGNWGGTRDKLSDIGIDASVEYKADLWAEVSGGLKRGNNYLDNTDIKFAIDGEKLFGVTGNKVFIYFLNNFGGKPNAHQVGSTQGIDNIEVTTNTFKLYEAWMEQSFWGKKLSVLLGLHDLNSEFDQSDMTANFIKPTAQIGQSFAQSGKNAPSIFPNTSLAGRLKYTPIDTAYFSAAVFDGVPQNPTHPHGTHIDLSSKDGLLLIAEAGFTPKAADADGGSTPNKFAVGAWTYSKAMDDLVSVDLNSNPIKRRMAGAYAISSYQFYHNKDTGHDLGAFFRAGMADGNTKQVNWDYETGLIANGWIPTRGDGELGLTLTQSHNSDKYMQLVNSRGGRYKRNEYALEFYYRDKIYRGVSVQPDVQYVINPSTNPTLKNATIVGIRLDVNF